jgi:hypothetical protein
MTTFAQGLPGLAPFPPPVFDRNPVHRGSTRKPIRWHRIDRNEAVRLYHQARRYDLSTKIAGKHGGAIGHAALKVLHTLIFDFLNFKTGQLDPSYEGIARKANLARSTVAEALRRLRALGILNWLRRCSDRYEGGRYELRQDTNAYAILPASQWAEPVIGPVTPPPPDPASWGARPPMPTVIGQALEETSIANQVRVLELEPENPLTAALARLGKALAIKAAT